MKFLQNYSRSPDRTHLVSKALFDLWPKKKPGRYSAEALQIRLSTLCQENICGKRNFCLVALASVFLFCCDNQALDNDTAEKLIIKEYQLPKPVDHTISTGDPIVAKKLLDLGLERDGLVKIKQQQTFGEAGRPWIEFTDKGSAYFLLTPDEEIKYQRQNVKVAVKEFDEIKSIALGEDNKTAVVEFSVAFKEPSPFSVLAGQDFSKPKIIEVFFVRHESGWKIDNKKGSYMLMGL